MEAVGTIEDAARGGKAGIASQKPHNPHYKSPLIAYHAEESNPAKTTEAAVAGTKWKAAADKREDYKGAFVSGVPIHLSAPPNNNQYQFKYLGKLVS